ncbi:threonine aldolase family protein [Nigerium sp.]|uniref:threonine aldolase family protein n=1 Tax=Nigerium sp. TaxID=2042655 RepID=UPI003221EFC2
MTTPMIDLRSDTVTQPTDAMRRAMAEAPVGDDVYGEDPSIADLEARVAALLGHEAGLFCVTGSLSNQLGVWAQVRPGQEVLCDAGAHIARAEMGAHGALSGVTMRTWVTPHGVAEAAQIERLLSPDAGPYLVSTACVALENTHNFGGGTIQPLAHLREVAALCRDAGVGLHLDGARLWNAHVASGVALSEYGRLFDTVSVCFSKGLGAPVGSMLLASEETIARARVQRKRLGAGWRQAGVLAAAASYAVEHHVGRLADDHAAARAFADAVAAAAPGAVGRPETNIVVVGTGVRTAAQVVAEASARGVAISAVGGRVVRAVTHLGVSLADAARAGAIVGEILAGVGVST